MVKSFKLSSELSLTTTRTISFRVALDGKQKNGGQSTSFYWLIAGDLYLITNLHNLTGWDNGRQESLSAMGIVPTHIRGVLNLPGATSGGGSYIDSRMLTLPLYGTDGAPLWLEHPVYRGKVDVAAIHACKLEDDPILHRPINTCASLLDFGIEIGDDVFVLGYPKGLTGAADFPIWKRGSLATEPEIDLDDLPKMLIDTATRQGMSGSPVIVQRSGLAIPPGESIGSSRIGTTKKFLGVYSGRIGEDELGVQLGIVWKARVIDEIIAGGVRGTAPH